MSTLIPELPTSKFLEHITKREGKENTVYYDSVGRLTVGVGHLVTEEDDLHLYQTISDEMVATFLRDDSTECWQAAVDQAVELDRIEIPFIEALASVNFQLGTSWYKIHKRTWKLMMEGEWHKACGEAADSLWFQQTPIRVRDFQEALTNGR